MVHQLEYHDSGELVVQLLRRFMTNSFAVLGKSAFSQ